MLQSAAVYRRYLRTYALVAAGGRPGNRGWLSELRNYIAGSEAMLAAEAVATRDALRDDAPPKSKAELATDLDSLLGKG